MNRNDTGIDACNLIDTIVQCKLRQYSLTWNECGNFFGSIIYTDEEGNLKVRWNKLIITRNNECKLSYNLNEKLRFKHFTDKAYPRNEIISYCKNLIENPNEFLENLETFQYDKQFEKRNYQQESIKMINDVLAYDIKVVQLRRTGTIFVKSAITYIKLTLLRRLL